MSGSIQVGWREWVTLPSLGIPAIKAKIDTGARSSSLHTHALEVFERDGVPWARFRVMPVRKHPETALDCEAPVHRFASVRDSGGHTSDRPFIKSTIEIGGESWEVELNLVDREKMLFPMLLGRTAMADHCIIDPSLSYAHGRWGRDAYPMLKRKR